MKRVLVLCAICFFLLSLVGSLESETMESKTVEIEIISISQQIEMLKNQIARLKMAELKESEKSIRWLQEKLKKMGQPGTPKVKLFPSNTMGADWGETIVWTSASPFTIHFGPNSPVNGMVFRSIKFSDNPIRYKVVAKVVHKHCDFGGIRTKYIVASYDAGKNIVEILDPDLEIPKRK